MMLRTSFLVLTCVACSLWAQAGPSDLVPDTINYQGTLSKSNGAVETGPKALQFRLYANEADGMGAALWGEQHNDVELYEGVFDVELGHGAAIAAGPPHGSLKSVFTQNALWLGVAVDEGGTFVEKTGRQQLTSSPYAMTADTAMTARHGVPVGTISIWAGTGNPPEGWLACDGQSYSTGGDYAPLFSAIGHTWGGSGDTFNVPNFGGRALVGAGTGNNVNTDTSVAGIVNRTLGTLLGAEKHRLTVAEMPSHTHTYNDKYYSGTDLSYDGPATARANTLNSETRNTTNAGGVIEGVSTDPNVASPHNNIQPSTVVRFIIKY